jgi:hypothetical protein
LPNLTRDQAVKGTEAVYEDLKEPLENASEVLDVLISKIGQRTANNLYLFDDLQEARVLTKMLRETLTRLLSVPYTVRFDA